MPHADPLRAEVEEMFETIDGNGDRRISYPDFVCLLLDLDREWQPSAIRRQFDVIDRDRDGFLSFEEFHAWVAPRRTGPRASH
jgi:Ca2+-binding EF-hand superfamily protein